MHLSAIQHDIPAFVAECKARLQKILQRLEWSEEGVLRNFNTNSLAATPQLHKRPTEPHTTEASTYPDSCISKNCLKLDTPQLQNLLQDNKLEAPTNFLDLQANFSREQKLRIYEHTIQNTKKLDNNAVDEVPEGERSLADIVAEKKREAKHKRRKFRVAKPTRIEEVRAVVELQMQSLQQFIKNQKKEDQWQETRQTDLYRRPIDARWNHDNDHRSTYNMDKSTETFKNEKSYPDYRSRGRREEKYKRSETIVNKNSTYKSSSKVYRNEYEYSHYKSTKSKQRSRSKSPKFTKRKHRSRSKSPHYTKAKYSSRSRSPRCTKSKYRSRSKSPKITKRKQRSRSKSPKSTEYYKRSHQKANDEKHRRKSSRSPNCSKSSTDKDAKKQHGRTRVYDQYNTDEKRENARYNHKISEDREISMSKKDNRSERRDQGQIMERRNADPRRSTSRDECHRRKKKHKRSRTRSRSHEHRKRTQKEGNKGIY